MHVCVYVVPMLSSAGLLQQCAGYQLDVTCDVLFLLAGRLAGAEVKLQSVTFSSAPAQTVTVTVQLRSTDCLLTSGNSLQ